MALKPDYSISLGRWYRRLAALLLAGPEDELQTLIERLELGRTMIILWDIEDWGSLFVPPSGIVMGIRNSSWEGWKMNFAFLVGRLIVGAYYIYSGLNHLIKLGQLTEYAKYKGVPMPQVAVIGSGVLLLVGGITLLSGKFPEIGVAALVLFFIPVSFMMHNFWAVGAEMKAGEQVNFLKNMALLGSALMFLAIKKPWPLSVGNAKK